MTKSVAIRRLVKWVVKPPESVSGAEYRVRCGLEKLQPVIDAALMPRTLMKDARGSRIR